MRESEDRPDANLGLIQFRWENWRAFPCRLKHRRWEGCLL